MDPQPSQLLSVLEPESEDLWVQPPSPAHAAAWLSWWASGPTKTIRQLVMTLGLVHTATQNSAFLSRCYRCSGQHEAIALLSEWTGIDETDEDGMPAWQEAFLPSLSGNAEAVRQQISRALRQRIIQGGLAQGERILWTCRDGWIRQQTARDILLYLASHPDDVTHERIERLIPYVDSESIERVRKNVKPPLPGPVPNTPEGIFRWYEDEYRHWYIWAIGRGLAEFDREAWEAIGSAFTLAFLDVYQSLLDKGAGTHTIAWYRSGMLRQSIPLEDTADSATLLLVLDGVGPTDTEYIVNRLRHRCDQLTVTSSEYVFSAPPTATPFTKPTVVMGRTPGEAYGAEADFRGLKDWPHVADALVQRSLVSWSLEEPDKRYHQSIHSHDHEAVRSGVEDALDLIARNVARVLERIVPAKPLELVVTADHGRLLINAQRTVAPPAGLQSHGRCAWGTAIVRPTLDGPYTREAGNIWLSPQAFFLPEQYDYVVRADSNAFTPSNDAKGLETFPHGGLYPEEVIVPWIVMKSSVLPPDISLVAEGEGEKGAAGTIRMTVTNNSDYSLTLVRVLMTSGDAERHLPVSKERVAPLSSISLSMNLDGWPDTERAGILAIFRLPDGRETPARTAVSLQTRALYRQTDPLADLEF